MATNAELEKRVEELEQQVRKLTRVTVEMANAMQGGGHLTPAQTAVIRKVMG